MRSFTPVWILVLFLVLLSPPALARDPELTDAEKADLDRNFAKVLRSEKGPYTQNFCVCRDGKRKPVELPDGTLGRPGGG